MIIKSNFKPAWWLSNPHLQTIFPTLTRRLKAPIDGTERLELPDGDFIDLSWAANGQAKEAPLVILLHGLGGNAHSTYVSGLMHAFNRRGWRVVLMHFRGASDEPNRVARAYHSGDTGDVHFLLQQLAQREPYTKKAVVGISMGGNVLLKWLGERGHQSLINAAVAVSVPFQLRMVSNRVNQGFSRIYQRYLLSRLKQVFERKKNKGLSEYPQIFQDIHKWRCFWTFDEYVTAPLNGFPHVHAYYHQVSATRYLSNIATQTLIIHALDDPFMTPDIVPLTEELPDKVTLELSAQGGHVGFITGKIPGVPTYWLEQRIPDYLTSVFNLRYE